MAIALSCSIRSTCRRATSLNIIHPFTVSILQRDSSEMSEFDNLSMKKIPKYLDHFVVRRQTKGSGHKATSHSSKSAQIEAKNCPSTVLLPNKSHAEQNRQLENRAVTKEGETGIETALDHPSDGEVDLRPEQDQCAKMHDGAPCCTYMLSQRDSNLSLVTDSRYLVPFFVPWLRRTSDTLGARTKVVTLLICWLVAVTFMLAEPVLAAEFEKLALRCRNQPLYECDLANCTGNMHLLGNGLSGTIPASLGSLNKLTQLHLNNNQLSGTIPNSLGSLRILSFLHLHYNQLSGTIPANLGSIKPLTRMILLNNTLSGTIPDSLGRAKSLSKLGLYDNNLSGTIPSNLGSSKSLTLVMAQNNHLSGTIPDSLGRTKLLVSLHLNDNQLTGTVPASFGRAKALKRLYLFYNQLSGTVPDSLRNSNSLTQLVVTKDDLRMTIPPSEDDEGPKSLWQRVREYLGYCPKQS